MSIFNYKQRNNIILVGIVILGCFLVFALRGLTNSILGAIVLFTIFRPVYLNLTEKRRWGSGRATTLIIVISFIAIVIPFLAVSILVVNKISELASSHLPIQEWLSKVDAFAGSHLNQPHFVDTININEKVGNFVTNLFPSILSSAADISLTILVMYFLLFYMFTQIKEFEATLVRYAPFREVHALKFASELRNATYSNVLGQGIISLSQGIIFAIGLTIVDFPDPIFWGVIGTFISFLPVVGVPVMSIAFSIILFFNGHTWKGFFLLGWGFVLVVYLDNYLRLFINKRVANTHPLITIIGVVIGIPLFGILGLVFGPVLLSFFLLLVEIYETNRMAEERLDRINTNNDE
ncbi:AI-2E family transporter [Mucilaginibacter sp. HMF5004]|uniref:AI-2E family transporter n=1 Tax=Mucilaginibacter rivuli TaxID=2857527 RepID=UPI001C5E1B86|nr:AI-2E family transporter [Mucilaginibacter rivuli]MBW4888100.1 AI-2E family transporter [Mucilaginibacter rivuli]